MGLALESIDVPRARKNGILQIINGCLCIVFNAAIFIFMAATRDYLYESQCSAGGIWGGLFYIASGALILVCAKRQNLCMGISALTLNVLSVIVNLVHVVYMSLSVMSDERRRFISRWWDGETDHRTYWRKPIYVVLFSISTILAYAELLLLIWAIFMLSEAFYWRRFRLMTTSDHASTNGDPPPAKANESTFNHALATVSVRVNAVFQAVIAFLSASTNIAILIVFVWWVARRYEDMTQTNGTAIITAPFFFVLAYFGYTAGQTGSNKRLVTYLVLSIVCGLLCFLEGGGAVTAIANHYEMRLPSIEVCETKPDRWGRNRTTCNWVDQPGAAIYVPLLITLNSVIILFALLHLALSIWGVVISSIALHKDGACFTCFRNCFCLECGSRGCGDVCEDSCCVGGGGPRSVGAGAHYQPIQFVVSHQGTTTMADGQQALVVLLPLTGNMNVNMDNKEGGAATVTVNQYPAGVAEVPS